MWKTVGSLWGAAVTLLAAWLAVVATTSDPTSTQDDATDKLGLLVIIVVALALLVSVGFAGRSGWRWWSAVSIGPNACGTITYWPVEQQISLPLKIRGGHSGWIDVRCLIINNTQVAVLETHTRLSSEGPVSIEVRNNRIRFPSVLAPFADVVVSVKPRWYEGKSKTRTQASEFVIHDNAAGSSNHGISASAPATR